MSEIGEVTKPDTNVAAFHSAKRDIHRQMQALERVSRQAMLKHAS